MKAEALRRRVIKLEILCLLLALAFLGSMIAYRSAQDVAPARLKRSYEQGFVDGARLAPKPAPVAAPAPAGRRGPLDLTKLSEAQIRGLHCYIQEP